MRFKCIDRKRKREEKLDEKIQSYIDHHNYLLNWHPWFAWYPVKLGKYEDCVWLETIWRRFNDYDDHNLEYSNIEYLDANCAIDPRVRRFEPLSNDAMGVPVFKDVTNGVEDEY